MQRQWCGPIGRRRVRRCLVVEQHQTGPEEIDHVDGWPSLDRNPEQFRPPRARILQPDEAAAELICSAMASCWPGACGTWGVRPLSETAGGPNVRPRYDRG
jgi:hypothetical protein